jgi:plasmid maintenance system antidote protein VapI
MRPVLSTPTGEANPAGAQGFTRQEKSFSASQKIINAIKACWPRKTAAHVAHLTEVEERTVRFWIAGETRMSVDAVAALLRTEEGYAVLEAIMTGCSAKWWVAMQTHHDIRKSRRAVKAEEERVVRLKAQLSLLD